MYEGRAVFVRHRVVQCRLSGQPHTPSTRRGIAADDADEIDDAIPGEEVRRALVSLWSRRASTRQKSEIDAGNGCPACRTTKPHERWPSAAAG